MHESRHRREGREPCALGEEDVRGEPLTCGVTREKKRVTVRSWADRGEGRSWAEGEGMSPASEGFLCIFI